MAFTVEEWVFKARQQGYVELDAEEMNKLLKGVEIVSEEDTCMCGMIRVLQVEEGYLSQETTDQGVVVLRFFTTRAEAESLVRSHLNTYANMWDGCGCKVRYYPEKPDEIRQVKVLADAIEKKEF